MNESMRLRAVKTGTLEPAYPGWPCYDVRIYNITPGGGVHCSATQAWYRLRRAAGGRTVRTTPADRPHLAPSPLAAARQLLLVHHHTFWHLPAEGMLFPYFSEARRLRTAARLLRLVCQNGGDLPHWQWFAKRAPMDVRGLYEWNREMTKPYPPLLY
jgi:hypothetical protein